MIPYSTTSNTETPTAEFGLEGPNGTYMRVKIRPNNPKARYSSERTLKKLRIFPMGPACPDAVIPPRHEQEPFLSEKEMISLQRKAAQLQKPFVEAALLALAHDAMLVRTLPMPLPTFGWTSDAGQSYGDGFIADIQTDFTLFIDIYSSIDAWDYHRQSQADQSLLAAERTARSRYNLAQQLLIKAQAELDAAALALNEAQSICDAHCLDYDNTK